MVEPETLLKEIRACEVEADRLILDERAVVIVSEDREWEEENLKEGIGSTAQGVGKATARRVTNRFRDERACKLARDLGPEFRELRPYLGSTSERLEKAYARGEKILLEGTQGTGLSIFHGDYPSVTSRDTTVSGCLSEAGIGPATGQQDCAGLSNVPNSRRQRVRQLLEGDRLGDGGQAVEDSGEGTSRA